MYLQFYQLSRPPFQPGDEAAFFWKGEQYRQALSVLRQVTQKGGVSLLTGDVGTGKTAVVHALLREMGKRAVTCLISDPDLTVADFFRLVLHGFRVHRSVDTREAFQDHLGRLLHKAARRRRSVLLVIDEAQHLPPELADELAAAAASRGTAAGLHICLVGQSAAGREALRTVIGPLDRHIAADLHLLPLDAEETAAYVRHRLAVAGAGQEIFSDEALQEVHRQSDGIPIQINLICDFALFSGFAERTPVITDDIVRWSADGLRLPEPLEEEAPDTESPEEDFFTEDAAPQTTEEPAAQKAAFLGDGEVPGDALSPETEETIVAPQAPAEAPRATRKAPPGKSAPAPEAQCAAAQESPASRAVDPPPPDLPAPDDTAAQEPEEPAADEPREALRPAGDETSEMPPDDEPAEREESARFPQERPRPQTDLREPEPAALTDLPGDPVRRSRVKPALAAAAVLVLLAAGGYLLVAKPGGVSLPALLKRLTLGVSATPEAPAVASQSAAPPMPVVLPVPQAPPPAAEKTPPAVPETGPAAPASAAAAEDTASPSLSGPPTGIIEEDLTDETQTARTQESSAQVRAAVEPPAEPEAEQEAPPPAEEKASPPTVRRQPPAQVTETPAAFAPEPLAGKTASAPQPAGAKIPAPPTEAEEKPAASEPTSLVGATAPPAESEPPPAAVPAEAPVPLEIPPAEKASPLPPATAQAPPPENPQPPAQSAVTPAEAEKAPAPAAAPVTEKPAPPSPEPPAKTAQAEPPKKHGIRASSLLKDILKDGAFFESSPQSSAPREEAAAPPPQKKAETSASPAPQRMSGEPDPSAVINWLLKKKGK